MDSHEVSVRWGRMNHGHSGIPVISPMKNACGVVPRLALMREDAEQRQNAWRGLFNALRYMVRFDISRGQC